MLISTISDVMEQWLSCSFLCEKFNYFFLYRLAYNALRVVPRFQALSEWCYFLSSGVSLRQRSMSGATFRSAFRTMLLFVSRFQPCYYSASLENGATFRSGRRYINVSQTL